MEAVRKLMRRKKRQKEFKNHGWSKLHPDLLRPILESLSSTDFDQAKAVCSDWYAVSKTCVRRSLSPWRITYQGHASMLLDPKQDQTNLLGLYCMACSGDWVLLVNSRLDFFVLNLLTLQRINLPSIRSLNRHRNDDVLGCKNSALLWVSEKAEDFVVAWVFQQHFLYIYKKGKDSWWKWNRSNSGFHHMAYKNSKLYLYTLHHHIKVIDFSRDTPREARSQNPYWNRPFRFVEQPWEYIWKRKIAIRNSGEVLIILSLNAIDEDRTVFYVFKMNLESGNWERVDSIGDNEMLIFGHGVTVNAPLQNAVDGIKSDSICFVDEDVWPGSNHPSNCGVFDLSTSRITWPKRFGFGVYIDKTQWFVPGFGKDAPQIMDGQEAGNAAEDAVQAFQLESTFWGISLFRECRRSLRRTYVLLISMLFVFIVAVVGLTVRTTV